MNSERGTGQQREDGKREPKEVSPHPAGSEAAQKGGKEPAQRQAKGDWENSSKESGE
jgi:hypothetical protein